MRVSKTRLFLAASAALQAVPSALAWGAAGHEIVATIAQIHLHPSVLPQLCTLLRYDPPSNPGPYDPPCYLAPIAAWADRVRRNPHYRWTGPLHYINSLDDYPSETCAFPGEQGWAGVHGHNVISAIGNTTKTLVNFVESEDEYDDYANDALKFFVHFLGDMHMPLHLAGRDKGGNGVKVLFDGRVSNLHSVWDSLLIAKTLRSFPSNSNYSRPLPVPEVETALRGAIYDPYVRKIMWEGIMGYWQDEVEEWLSCPASAPSSSSSSGSDSSFLSALASWVGQAPFLPSSLSHIINGALVYFTSAKGPEPEHADTSVVCPYHWAQPIHDFNCEFIWPKAFDQPPYVNGKLDDILGGHAGDHHHSHAATVEEELAEISEDGAFLGHHEQDPVEEFGRRPRTPWLELDTPEYSGVIRERLIIEKLLAQAGIRLAGLLNAIFATEEGGAGGAWVKPASL